LNSRDRPLTQVGAGPIPTMAIMALCELYDATFEDFEKILKLDSILYKGPEGGATREEDPLPKNVVKMLPKNLKPPNKRRR
jgi:hypothetical protein